MLRNVQVPPVYGLDASSVSGWDERVREPACRVVDAFVTASRCDLEPLAVASASVRDEQTSFHCRLCDRVTVGRRQWEAHLSGNRHRKMMKRAARLAHAAHELPAGAPQQPL